MGFIGELTGWDQFGARQNAVLATHLLDTTNPDLKQKITTHIIDHLFEIYHERRSVEELIEDLNNRPRGVQMQFIALACIDLGISPNIRNHAFTYVKNPYRAKDWASDKEVGYIVVSTKRLIAAHPELYAATGAVNWPGNNAKVDFTKLFAKACCS